ncbi:MAG: DUF2256 domain-containing protein [Pseudohongiellaceae bacterium]|jgi:hypothetical protein
MTHAKRILPEKNCQYCQRPFKWRKKWWRCWDDVKYCSKYCKQVAKRASNKPQANLCALASVEDEF